MTAVPALLFEADPATGAVYWTLRDEPVVRSIDVPDVATIDLNADGDPVGLELPFGPTPTHEDWLAIFNVMPSLKEAFPNVL